MYVIKISASNKNELICFEALDSKLTLCKYIKKEGGRKIKLLFPEKSQEQNKRFFFFFLLGKLINIKMEMSVV